MTERLGSQRSGARGRPAMMSRLFIGVGQLDHVAVVVGPSEESNASGKVVTGKARGNNDRGHVYQEGVQMGRSFIVHKRRLYAFVDESGLVLHGFVHDGDELMVNLLKVMADNKYW